MGQEPGHRTLTGLIPCGARPANIPLEGRTRRAWPSAGGRLGGSRRARALSRVIAVQPGDEDDRRCRSLSAAPSPSDWRSVWAVYGDSTMARIDPRRCRSISRRAGAPRRTSWWRAATSGSELGMRPWLSSVREPSIRVHRNDETRPNSPIASVQADLGCEQGTPGHPRPERRVRITIRRHGPLTSVSRTPSGWQTEKRLHHPATTRSGDDRVGNAPAGIAISAGLVWVTVQAP